MAPLNSGNDTTETTDAAELSKLRAAHTKRGHALRDHVSAVRQQVNAIDLTGLDNLLGEYDEDEQAGDRENSETSRDGGTSKPNQSRP
jgi:hypothetical protein